MSCREHCKPNFRSSRNRNKGRAHRRFYFGGVLSMATRPAKENQDPWLHAVEAAANQSLGVTHHTHPSQLKLASCPHSLAATVAVLPSMLGTP